jgi:hypothetical protein
MNFVGHGMEWFISRREKGELSVFEELSFE